MTRTVADLLPDSSMFASMERSKDTHLEKMETLFDWERFRETLERAWPWTLHDLRPGRPSWDAVSMFKVLVVGKTKGDLSDEALEDLYRFHVRVVRFLGLKPGTAGPAGSRRSGARRTSTRSGRGRGRSRCSATSATSWWTWVTSGPARSSCWSTS